MAPRVTVEGGNTHKAVDPAFRFQIAVGKFAGDFEDGALDARFITRLHVDDLILPAATLEPAAVHTQQNARPVAGFRAARAGVDVEITVVPVELAGEETHQFDFIQIFFQSRPGAVRFFQKHFIFGGEFRNGKKVIGFPLDRSKGFDHVLAGGKVLHGCLCRFLVIPEIRLCHNAFDLFDLGFRFIDLQKGGKFLQTLYHRLPFLSYFFNRHHSSKSFG